MRREMNVPQNKRPLVYLEVTDDEIKNILEQSKEAICKLSFAGNIEISSSVQKEKCASAVNEYAKIYIPLGELVDKNAEIACILCTFRYYSSYVIPFPIPPVPPSRIRRLKFLSRNSNRNGRRKYGRNRDGQRRGYFRSGKICISRRATAAKRAAPHELPPLRFRPIHVNRAIDLSSRRHTQASA